MSIDRNYWKNLYFRNDKIPVILCPTCKIGHLKKSEEFLSIETRNSIELSDLYYSNEHNYEANFISFLICDNKKCKDNVAVVGNAFLEPEDDSEFEREDEFTRHPFFMCYNPKFFLPPLEIINLKKEYPISVNNALKDSFKLFFTDNESCANKIRVVVEVLLDKLKVKRTYINKGKKENYSLHKRIELYRVNNPDIAQILLSVKWIGNFGSHKEKIKKDDLIDAYELLQNALDKLYDDSSKKILALAKKINKNKKPASRLKTNK